MHKNRTKQKERAQEQALETGVDTETHLFSESGIPWKYKIRSHNVCTSDQWRKRGEKRKNKSKKNNNIEK